MKLKITINMDNAAFGEDGHDASMEVMRILTKYMTQRLSVAEFDMRFLDINGNHVGDAEFWED